MTNRTRRPSFVECFLEDLQEGYRSRGAKSLIPFYGLMFLGLGAAVAWTVPTPFWESSWTDGHRDVSTAVYAAVMMFNGLLLAMSWSAFAKIHELIGARAFCHWLREKGMLHHYIFIVDFVQLWQIAALLCSVAALFSLLYDVVPLWAHRVILAAMLGSAAYAIRWAAGAVQVMHDIVWYKAIFEEQHGLPEQGSVVPFGQRG